jgi:signal transduction histidine kinase/CheY-like chemotaxis protein
LSSRDWSHRRWPVLAAFGLALGAVATSAAVMLASVRADALAGANAQLEAVGALKVDALQTWIADRVQAAKFACSYPTAMRAAEAARTGRVDASLRAHLDEILAHFAERWSYPLAAMLDGAGQPISVVGRAATTASLPDRWFLEWALADPQGAATALGVAADGTATLEVAVAARRGPGAPSFCVLQADATRVVEEVLERWPVPSRSGRGLLIRAEGDAAVLFLARRDRAPERLVRVPLAQREVAAVRALRGDQGLIEGLDRSGLSILARARAVPGTAWVLETRLDRDEVLAPIRPTALAVAGGLAVFLLVGGALLVRWWRDEHRREEAEEALRRSRERLQLAIAGTHAVWSWDLAEGRLQIEGELARQIRFPAEGLAGEVPQVVDAIVHEDDREQVLAAIEKHLHGRSPVFEAEFRSAQAPGSPWIRVRGHVVGRDDQARPSRMAGVASDINEWRRLQSRLDLSLRLAGLGRLAAGVAHEINNPLSFVIANLAWVAEELKEAPPEVRQALVEARDGAVRVAEVVRGLRAFSRPGPATRAPVDVRPELDAALRMANNEIRHRATLDARIGELPRVVADPQELGQVFLNLLVNAVQATPEGNAQQQRIEVVAATDARGWASVEIRDHGVGIAPEVLPRIFEPYFTTRPLGSGAGLGLSVAHGIVSAAGGRIDVESILGRGSTFRVLLPPAPLPPTATAGASPAPPASAAAAPGRPPPRVLVIDDEPLVANAVVRALGPGYDVTKSHCARDALAMFEAGTSFDVVLCDLMMPEINGMELWDRVAKRDPGLATRFVFISGGAFTETAADFLRASSNACIEKPFQAKALRETVDRVAAGG